MKVALRILISLVTSEIDFETRGQKDILLLLLDCVLRDAMVLCVPKPGREHGMNYTVLFSSMRFVSLILTVRAVHWMELWSFQEYISKDPAGLCHQTKL